MTRQRSRLWMTLTLCGALLTAPNPSHAAGGPQAAVRAAVARQMGHATPLNPAVQSYSVGGISVAGAWALAHAVARRPALGPVTLLLHRQAGPWRVVALGTSLRGAGRQYGVPHVLWARWGL